MAINQDAPDETRKADQPERDEMTENRASIDELVIGDWVSWNALDPEIAAVVTAVEGDQAVLSLYEFEDGIFVPTELIMPINVFKLEKIQRPEMLAEKLPEMHDMQEDAPEADPASDIKAKAEEIIAKIEAINESEPMTEPVVANRDKWLSAAWKIKARLEGSEGRSIGGVETRSHTVELRAEGDGMSFSGYAALFNEPSLPLPFTEIVKPGAFKRSLQSRNRMMLLWNHDTSNPLASTRNGSLQLTEDARGLKVTATLPQTSLGRDLSVLVKSGVIDAMSFGFSVKRDSWSQDGNTRYLEDVSLYEVSLVSTPAYEQTSGTVSVRSAGISADALADALLKIESGDELDSEQGALMRDVIERLSKTEPVAEPTEPEGDITALYAKKLALAELSK
jgi:HK97 family phage prohead protease